jgi:hypothetical protein
MAIYQFFKNFHTMIRLGLRVPGPSALLAPTALVCFATRRELRSRSEHVGTGAGMCRYVPVKSWGKVNFSQTVRNYIIIIDDNNLLEYNILIYSNL